LGGKLIVDFTPRSHSLVLKLRPLCIRAFAFPTLSSGCDESPEPPEADTGMVSRRDQREVLAENVSQPAHQALTGDHPADPACRRTVRM